MTAADALSGEGPPLRFAGVLGPEVHWGAAREAIRTALALDGIRTEISTPSSLSAFMTEASKREQTLAGSGHADVEPFDEAGMLVVDRGAADVVVNFKEMVIWATQGIGHHSYIHRNLRALARITQPQFVGIAVRDDTGVTSLEQIATERIGLRLATISRNRLQTRTLGYIITRIFEECGFHQEDLEAWGGKVFSHDAAYEAIVNGQADIVALPAYSYWGPQWGPCWLQAQVRMNLRFLSVPERVQTTLAEELRLTPGVIPPYLFRGLTSPIGTFVLADHIVSAHADVSPEDAYKIVQAMDRHPECLQQTHAAFAFNPNVACQDLGIPIHPGAETYYRDHGYPRDRNSG